MAVDFNSPLLTELGQTMWPEVSPANRWPEPISASLVDASLTLPQDAFDSAITIALSLCQKRPADPLCEAWIHTLPVMAEFGDENAPAEIKTTLDTLLSLTSRQVCITFIDALPTISDRLGGKEPLKNYLSVIDAICRGAPHCLKLVFQQQQQLLTKLPVSGFCHWAQWGLRAHTDRPAALTAYFSLASADSKLVFQRERHGVLLVDNRRSLALFLRAIWGKDFWIRPLSGDTGYQQTPDLHTQIPAIEEGKIMLPEALDDHAGLTGKQLYRAAAAHCAAHLMYSSPWQTSQFPPEVEILTGFIEDLRAERLAMSDFPGLQSLWLAASSTEEKANGGNNASSLLTKINQSILSRQGALDESKTHNASGYPPLVADFINQFEHQFKEQPHDPKLSETLGLALFNKLHDAGLEVSLPASRYRDSNTALWQDNPSESLIPWRDGKQVKRTVNIMEMANDLDCELAGDDAQEIWTLESPFYRDGDPIGTSLNELESRETAIAPSHYPEWDYQAGIYRPGWTTVFEHKATPGSLESINAIIHNQRPLTRKIRHLIEALQPRGLTRMKRQYEGDDLDLDAAIEAMKECRRGALPDTNIDLRLKRHQRDLAVTLLIDLSHSTNDLVVETGTSILDIAREATVMLSGAIDGIGDPFSVHGFSSNGRHEVLYTRFKDFDQPYDDTVKCRLSGMTGSLSTRMGAAIRHAGKQLEQQPQRKKLLLLLSDGEPADIDVQDPHWLRADTKKAVDELSIHGITTYCLTIDPLADQYVSEVFGHGHYTVLDNVQVLPEKLPRLFATLTRR